MHLRGDPFAMGMLNGRRPANLIGAAYARLTGAENVSLM